LVGCLLPLFGFAQGKCRSAGALEAARSGHTATLLQDGRVLVVGGRGSDATTELLSVELYQPKTNRWSAAASLSLGRAGHTATLLDDGRVLVTGGTGQDSTDGGHRYVALTSVELYDPRSNTWSAGAPMKDARNWHTATRLDDGRVLVAGGAREMRQHLRSAELFTPDAGTWAPAAPLAEARCLHQAVNVPGGVLVVGGRSNKGDRDTGYGGPLASVERYDAAANTWSAAPELTEPRQYHAVAQQAEGHTLVVCGAAPTLLTNQTEWLGPSATEWKEGAQNPPLGRAHHTATVLPSGDVLVIGGETSEAVDSDLAQRLDVKRERWCVAGQLKASRKKHTATLLKSGKVLVVGGTSAGIPEADAELCEVTAGACTEPPGPTLGF
jgi:Kelch motif/Galactose oxidase, central domain